MESPVMSVVTVTFNAVDSIEKTILSVINQTYGMVDYIIIDGGSDDGTQSVIEKYSDRISYYVSEPDKGLYDGMNKGINASKGDFLLFMNSDDIFADNDVVSQVAEFISKSDSNIDVLYGYTEQIHDYGTFIVKPQAAYIDHKMAISHQATFVRVSLLRRHPFDLRYKYAADFEQISSFYLSGHSFSYFDRLISRVIMTDGITYKHHIESVKELYSIIESRGVEISKERRIMIAKKRLVRFFKSVTPSFISKPVLRFVAKNYKAL